MARSPAQRGKIGNWLVESRLARGWDTQSEAREQIDRLTRWKIPQSVYAEWESGRRLPSEANLDRLRSFYGDAPGATETPAGDLGALIIEMREQNRLVGEVVKELREYRLLTVAAMRDQQTTQLGIEQGIVALAESLGSVIPLGGGSPKRSASGPAGPGRDRRAAE